MYAGTSLNWFLLRAQQHEELHTTDQLRHEITQLDVAPASKKYNLLCEAVQRNLADMVQILLSKGAEVNLTDTGTARETPLHMAARRHNVKIVKMLLEKKADVNASDETGRTPLHFAIDRNGVFKNNFEIIDLLLTHGANVNTSNCYGETPLSCAIGKGDLKLVQQLIAHCSNINFASSNYGMGTSNGYTPLHHAISRGQKDIVDVLIENNADININAAKGQTALHIAANKGYVEIADTLITRGANIHAVYTTGELEGYTALHSVVSGEYESYPRTELIGKTKTVRIIETLLSGGADVNAISKAKLTPLHLATMRNQSLEIIEILLKHGANPNALTNDSKTPLCIAVEEHYGGIVDLFLKNCPGLNNESNSDVLSVAVMSGKYVSHDTVEKLLNYGFSVVNQLNNNDMFHAAITRRCEKVVEELLKNGVQINNSLTLKDEKSFMPLHLAVEYNLEPIARLLVRYGADVNARDAQGNTPIMYVTLVRECLPEQDIPSTQIVKLLLENQADTKDNAGLLFTAVKRGFSVVAELLLDHNTDVDWGDSEGLTALHRAVFGYRGDFQLDMIKLLLAKGASVSSKTKSDISVLHIAALLDEVHVEVIETLLEFDAEVNVSCDSITPLHLSALRGSDVFCRLLLAKGADANAKLKDGKTALHVAVSKYPCLVAFQEFSGRLLSSKMLKRLHNEVFGRLSVDGFTSKELGFRFSVPKFSKLGTLDELIKGGAGLNIRDDDGKTALHYAAENLPSKMLAALVDHGADFTSRDNSFRTALQCAAEKYLMKNVKALVYLGADINCKDDTGSTPLHKLIVSQHRTGCLLDLLDLGSDINAVNKSNRTPLEEALRIEHNRRSYDDIISSEYFERNPILRRHVVKMKVANFYVKPTNLALTGNFTDDAFEEECKREIEAMKIEKIGNFSCYDILKSSKNQLTRLVKDENVVRFLEAKELLQKFQIYGKALELIAVRMRQLRRKTTLLELSKEVFRTCIAGLPDLCVDLVLNNLSDYDLECLTRAYHPDIVLPDGPNFMSEDGGNDDTDDENELFYYDSDEDDDLYSSSDYYYGSSSDFDDEYNYSSDYGFRYESDNGYQYDSDY